MRASTCRRLRACVRACVRACLRACVDAKKWMDVLNEEIISTIR